MTTKRMWLALALAAALLAPAAGAEEDAEAGMQLDEYGFAVGKDPAAGTVTVGDRVLRVGADAVVLDLQGRPLALADIPLRGDAPTMGQSQPGAVHYEAVRGARGEWRVVRLELVEAVPQ